MPTDESRQAAIALRALNVETAVVRDLAKNADAGKLRLAWWKEIISHVYEVCIEGCV
jgi:hypothetical protein